MLAQIRNFAEEKARFQVLDGTKPERNYKKRDIIGERKKKEALTSEEIVIMKDYLHSEIENAGTYNKEKMAARNYMLFVLGINIGIRGSDLVNLRWKDFYYENGILKEKCSIIEMKTKKPKDFGINKAGEEVLEWYKTTYNVNIEAEKNNFLFESQKGKQITRHRLTEILKETGKNAGINQSLSSHVLRKTFARHQIEAHKDDGMFLIWLMRLLNHESVESTLHYAGVTDDKLAEYYDDVNL